MIDKPYIYYILKNKLSRSEIVDYLDNLQYVKDFEIFDNKLIVLENFNVYHILFNEYNNYCDYYENKYSNFRKKLIDIIIKMIEDDNIHQKIHSILYQYLYKKCINYYSVSSDFNIIEIIDYNNIEHIIDITKIKRKIKLNKLK